ncbi:hypothetical protein [Wolbachia endosymbiont of Ctenocephalides felis wCfeT]|uniref:hypothetical protein n=1 Tax=Wolbachia endosymbiont of Ctenocephalides felis wCfeT TaxID=2732593 RepID=UPI0014483610|nr:hypothetical protein [Wolbachia endosymbiont of Ctenocephalides felis wCfeT]
MEKGEVLSFGITGHAVAVIRVEEGHMFFDPNKGVVGPLSKEKICDILECSANYHLHRRKEPYLFPLFEILNSAETIRKVTAHMICEEHTTISRLNKELRTAIKNGKPNGIHSAGR